MPGAATSSEVWRRSSPIPLRKVAILILLHYRSRSGGDQMGPHSTARLATNCARGRVFLTARPTASPCPATSPRPTTSACCSLAHSKKTDDERPTRLKSPGGAARFAVYSPVTGSHSLQTKTATPKDGRLCVHVRLTQSASSVASYSPADQEGRWKRGATSQARGRALS
jgi:hypothetical protein